MVVHGGARWQGWPAVALALAGGAQAVVVLLRQGVGPPAGTAMAPARLPHGRRRAAALPRRPVPASRPSAPGSSSSSRDAWPGRDWPAAPRRPAVRVRVRR